MADHQNEVEIEVPCFFLCPISLDIMKDPVILNTGITYDRDSIENWLFSLKKDFCPVTKIVLPDMELTPNHTLRRLIQSWCTLNAPFGVERFPTPRPPVTKPELIKLLKDSNSPQHQMIKSLKRLKSIVFESEKNKRLMESVGAADHLSTIITNVYSNSNNNSNNIMILSSEVNGADEALTILYHLKLSPTGVKSLLEKSKDFVTTLTRVMQRAASYESRACAVMLLKSMFEVAEPMHVTSLSGEFFTELVKILTDKISVKATKSTLKLLIGVIPWGWNRLKAVAAGVVAAVINGLLEGHVEHDQHRVLEMMMMVLVQVCQCADGRAAVVEHSGGLAVVARMVFGVSPVAGERAVRVLHAVAVFSGERRVVEEMVEVGVVERLLMVVNGDCGMKMKEKAKEVLKIHYRVWNKCSCVKYNL